MNDDEWELEEDLGNGSIQALESSFTDDKFLELPDIRGHEPIRAALQRELAEDRAVHCYLFVGPPGVGKRTVALAFLRAFLCHARRADGGACGACSACRASERGGHIDLHVVDAPTSGRGKLDLVLIRSRVVEAFDLVPLLSARRGVLIDGAETLTEEAQNALLKTLEEPPAGACLILVANSETALLPTILSRARLVRFGRPSREESLAVIASSEEMGESELARSEALELAAGSPGVALELLESEFFTERETFATWLLAGAPSVAELRELLPVDAPGARSESKLDERRERLRPVFQLALLVAGRELRRAHGVGTAAAQEALDDPSDDGLARRLWVAEACRIWTELGLRALEDLEAMVTPELVFELWAAGLPRAAPPC
jgi:DNA polymerase-3 subunit delta'